MFVSCLSLLNSRDSGALYPATLVPSYIVLIVSVVLAIRVAGGTIAGIQEAVTCGRATKTRNVEVNAE